MLTKKDILEALERLSFGDKTQLVVIAGAALVLDGITNSTNDVDVDVTDFQWKLLSEAYNFDPSLDMATFKLVVKDAFVDVDICRGHIGADDAREYGKIMAYGYVLQNPDDLLKLKDKTIAKNVDIVSHIVEDFGKGKATWDDVEKAKKTLERKVIMKPFAVEYKRKHPEACACNKKED